MRYVVTGEWTKNRLLMSIIWMFLLYVSLFWVTMGAMYFDQMGLSYQSVVDHYRGSEESFTQPRTYRGMLEVSHFHLFSMGILLLTLTHLVLFVPIAEEAKAHLIVASFLSAISNEASGWLVRFVHPLFAYLKIASFLSLELSLLALMGLVAWALRTGARNAYADSDVRRSGKGCNPFRAVLPVEQGSDAK